MSYSARRQAIAAFSFILVVCSAVVLSIPSFAQDSEGPSNERQEYKDQLKERYGRAKIVFNGCQSDLQAKCNNSSSGGRCGEQYIQSVCLCVADGMQGHQLRALREISDYFDGRIEYEKVGQLTLELYGEWLRGCKQN